MAGETSTLEIKTRGEEMAYSTHPDRTRKAYCGTVGRVQGR